MKLTTTLAATFLLTGGISSAANYLGNGNTGFGGVVSSLDITDDGTNLTFVLNRGTGTLNDAFVIYIDSTVGGANNTTQFTDTADGLRRAISGFSGSTRATVNLPSGFGVDRALALESSFGGLWSTVENGSHAFVATANGSPGGNAQASYSMTVSLANLGLNPGDAFNFVATYVNTGGDFRSNEGIGDGLPATNPGAAAVTFTAGRSYTTIPEPASAALGLLGTLLILRRRK